MNDKLIINLEKEDPFEIINKGELIEINPETNKYRKCRNKLSPYVIGVCIDEPKDISNIIPYEINKENYSVNEAKKLTKIETVNVQIAGIVTVKTNGIVCIGDLLVSNENGNVEAVRYKQDWNNLGRIIGKCIQMTENEDECIMLMTNM